MKRYLHSYAHGLNFEIQYNNWKWKAQETFATQQNICCISRIPKEAYHATPQGLVRKELEKSQARAIIVVS